MCAKGGNNLGGISVFCHVLSEGVSIFSTGSGSKCRADGVSVSAVTRDLMSPYLQ